MAVRVSRQGPPAERPSRFPRFFKSANIQTTAGYMRRLTPQGPAFKVAPRFVVVSRRGTMTTPTLVDGFEAGYVWDTKSVASTSHSNTRRPLKDGYYDHSQNCLEYVMLAFGPASGVKTAEPEFEPRPMFWGPDAWMAS